MRRFICNRIECVYVCVFEVRKATLPIIDVLQLYVR